MLCLGPRGRRGRAAWLLRAGGPAGLRLTTDRKQRGWDGMLRMGLCDGYFQYSLKQQRWYGMLLEAIGPPGSGFPLG
jgi:hypothetical protein